MTKRNRMFQIIQGASLRPFGLDSQEYPLKSDSFFTDQQLKIYNWYCFTQFHFPHQNNDVDEI